MKYAVIMSMTAENDIISDLGWDGPSVSVVYGVDEDDYLFIDADKSKCADWCDIRNYEVVPLEDVFEYIDADGWTKK